MSTSHTTSPASLGIDFDSRYGFVASLFAPSFALFRGRSGKWLHRLVMFPPHVASYRVYRGAFLAAHAVRTIGWSYINGCPSFTRFVAVRVSAPVNGVLSPCTTSGADKYGQHRSLQHRKLLFPVPVSFA